MHKTKSEYGVKRQEARGAQNTRPIRSFTDLQAWQESHRLVIDIYKVTRSFPDAELFGLTNQLRRASVSITSNVAEGFGRRTKDDRSRYYQMALASLAEVQSQLLVARDIHYLIKSEFDRLAARSIICHKILTGLINSTRARKS